MCLDPGHPRERILLARERGVIAGGVRETDQRAPGVVGPSVIGAAKRVRIAGFALAYGVAAMHAAVEQQVDRAILVARNDDRLQSDPARYVVARLGNLTFMRDVYPVAIPDLFQFFFEDGGIVVDSPAHAIVLNKVVVVGLRGKHGSHHSLPSSNSSLLRRPFRHIAPLRSYSRHLFSPPSIYPPSRP